MAAGTDMPQPNGSGASASTASFEAHPAARSAQRHEEPAPKHRSAVAALTHRLDGLAQEVSETRQHGEQLEASLEGSMRRIQQLIGERHALSSLLAERDAELQRLNRELGALAERAAPAVRGSRPLLAAARALLERVWPARTAPVRSRLIPASPEAMQQVSERALVPWIKNGPPKAVLGVVVFGLSEPEIENVLGIVERHCAERNLAPLLLTDNDAFQLFRGRRVLFEFLPPRSEQERLAPDLDWQLFTLRRLALIRRKWQPVRVVAFGRRAAEIMQLWLGSPFEATPIPAPMKAQPEGADMAWPPVGQAEALQL
jgi:hypothetical protein